LPCVKTDEKSRFHTVDDAKDGVATDEETGMGLDGSGRRKWVAPVLAAWVAIGAGAAWAEDISWRQASVQTQRDGANYVRRGAAILASGEPATVHFSGVWGRPQKPEEQPFSGRMTLRFEDGSSFSFDVNAAVAMPQGAITGAATFVEGTGRFAGIRGNLTMGGRGGLDPKVEGVLGDSFATFTGSYTLQK
jgi:hypothetical protein